MIGDLPAGAAILDVPCGSGVALRGLRPGKDVRYVAADIAPAMLDRTRRGRGARCVRPGRRSAIGGRRGAAPSTTASFEPASSPSPVCTASRIPRGDPRDRAGPEPGRPLRGPSSPPTAARATADGRRRPALGVLGPSATVAEVRTWLAESGFKDVSSVESGALAYLPARRARDQVHRLQAHGSPQPIDQVVAQLPGATARATCSPARRASARR